jgi:glycosyltransferase involved in cell wall biosynthesis
MKSSLVITLLNEEDSIGLLLQSISEQTEKPDEVVLVDGGSTDKTVNIIQTFQEKNSKLLNIKLFVRRGNRSVGRNEGIQQAAYQIILITDAGCLLDKNWVKEMSRPFKDKNVDVVAGYYSAKVETIFQKCLVPYALVMPDKIDPNNFLPATRSMALRRQVWSELGGFNEQYSHNEDYVFARKIKSNGKKILFAKEARAYWVPRRTFKGAFIMFRRFAYGDIEAGILRPKVVILFIRYFFILLLLLGSFYHDLRIVLSFVLAALFLIYCIWSVLKSYRYVRTWQAVYLLPLIQFTADFAILYGSIAGFSSRYKGL